MNLRIATNVHLSTRSRETSRTGSKTWHEHVNMVLIPSVDVKCADMAPNFGEREHVAWDPLATTEHDGLHSIRLYDEWPPHDDLNVQC